MLGQITAYAERILAPGPQQLIGAEIARLMVHYPSRFNTEGVGEQERKAIEAAKNQVRKDWLEDFSEYPVWVLAEACKRWRRGPKGMFAPSIADLRTLCAEVMEPMVRAKAQSARMARDAEKRRQLDEYADQQRRKMYPSLYGRTNNQSKALGRDE